tara:strand:+ start:55 stop:702 length:648 start_codon:yes stop_codon:yes gene_type:complete
MSGGEIEAMNFVNKIKKGVEDGAGNVTGAVTELGGEGMNKITTSTGPVLEKAKGMATQVPSLDDVKNMGGQAYDQHVANTQASNAEVGVNSDGSVDMDKMGNYVGDKINPIKNMGRIINVINAAGDGMKDQKQKYNAGVQQGIQDYNNSKTPAAPTVSPNNEAGLEGGRRRRRRRRTRRKKRRKSRKSRRRKRRKSRKKKRRRKSRKKTRRRRRR